MPPPREPTETAPVRAAAAPPPSPGDAKDASLPERPAAPVIDDDDEADGSPDEFWEREVAADVPSPDEAPTPPANPRDFREVVDLFATRREAILTAHLMHAVHLVAFAPGRIEVRLAPSAPRDLPGRLSACLGEWTGRRWVVTVSQAEGEPTLAEQEALAEQVRLAAAEALPLVQAVKQHFPGARITRVSHAESPASATQAPASSDEERQA